MRILATLRGWGEKITVGNAHELIERAPYINRKAVAKICDILDTGSFPKLDVLRRSSKRNATKNLCRLHGIGPSLATEIVEKHHISSVEELQQLVRKGDVDLRAVTHNSTDKFMLDHFQELQCPVKSEDISDIKRLLEKVAANAKLKLAIVGGVCRGKLSSHDLDFIFTLDAAWDSEEGKAFDAVDRQLRLISWLRKLAWPTIPSHQGHTYTSGPY